MSAAGTGGPGGRLPPGRLPSIGTPELVAALHHRREGRRRALAELRAVLQQLAGAIETRHERIAGILDALDAARDRGGA